MPNRMKRDVEVLVRKVAPVELGGVETGRLGRRGAGFVAGLDLPVLVEVRDGLVRVVGVQFITEVAD